MTVLTRTALGIGLLTAALGCQAGEPWTFSATRHLWTEGLSPDEVKSAYEGGDPDDPMQGFAICLLVCPIAVDIVLLPITVTHDLVYLD